ncbi:sialate:O-sulfotransferase 1-like [Palaemon carinicauda]|uniref:sialate:O-sulfotransferase 1-like n=1 Tax=Palaemon carinicauda TaxID=392227 RepID=UPI0035B5FAC3
MNNKRRFGCVLLCFALSMFYLYFVYKTSGNIRAIHSLLNTFNMSVNSGEETQMYPIRSFNDTSNRIESDDDESYALEDDDDDDTYIYFSGIDRKSQSSGAREGPPRDLSGKVRYPWRTDPLCKNYSTAFAKKMPRSFLVSFPRSGNTWVRYLIEGASGIFTGSKYGNSMLVKMGFLGEFISFKSRRTIINKIHSNTRKKVRDFSKVILLIRNPAKSIVSYWNYNNNKKGKKRIFYNVTATSYKKPAFRKFVKNAIGRWTKIASDRLEYSKKLLIVPYEYLLEDPIAQVRRILKFLGVPEDRGRLECLSRHTQGPALGLQRKVDPFTPDLKELMAERVREIQRLLKSRNMDRLPSYPEIPV